MATSAPPAEAITAFIGADPTKVGIRYPERILCIECSVKLDPRNLDIPLEDQEDHNQACDSCHSAI